MPRFLCPICHSEGECACPERIRPPATSAPSNPKLCELAELPEKPTGWTQSLLLHLNFGRGQGAADYSVKDADGNATPIGYHYNTQEGFSLPDVEKLMTWSELRAEWPKYLARQAEAK